MNTAAIDVSLGLPVEPLRAGLPAAWSCPPTDYDHDRMVIRGDIDDHPALIVRVANPNDVALAIAFARDNGLEIAVRQRTFPQPATARSTAASS